jgi:diacylglycerol O-acyltransferase
MARDDAYMSDSDAFSWYMETDPLLRSTIVSVVVLDEAPDPARLFDRVERASRMAPGFRHRVVRAPWRIANPRWVVDPDFNLAFHTRHLAVPAPGGLEQVFEYASQTGMAGFDRDRPLWEFTLLDGLEGGRAALILKLHHALTDGIGGMEMAKYLFDLAPEPATPGLMPDAPDVKQWSTVDLARDALCHNVSRIARVPGALFGTHRAVRNAVRHPARAVENWVELVRSVTRTVQPVRSTLSPIMTDRRLAWHYDAFRMPIDELRGAARACGLTLNDAFLGAISGGMLRYHERRGFSVDELRLTMPISVRTPDDPIGGNRITLMRFKVPTGLHDPVERMRRIHQLCLNARQEAAIPYTNTIAAALNVLPRGVVGSMLKHVDLLASNVPGIDVPVYLAGAHVAEWYAFGPTIGSAFNATLVSYDGTCFVGVNVDTGAIPDEDLLLECLRESFREIVALGVPGAAKVTPA